MEFAVDSISSKNNMYYVTGVCDSGSLKINSNFLYVYRYISREDAEGFPITLGKKYIRDVKLRIR